MSSSNDVDDLLNLGGGGGGGLGGDTSAAVASATCVPADAAAAADRSAPLPPMPPAAPPVPPPVGFDPLAAAASASVPMPSDASEVVLPSNNITSSAASSDSNIRNSDTSAGGVAVDADLLGTGEGMDPDQAAAQTAAMVTPTVAADSNDNDDDDSGSEYETETDEEDDDDMIVGFGRQTARTYADFDNNNNAAAAAAGGNVLLPSIEDTTEEDLLQATASSSSDFASSARSGSGEQQQHEEPTDNLLRPGDHVYSWVKRQQRHGIVLSIGDGLVSEMDPNDFDAYDTVTVVTFYSKDKRDRDARDGGDYSIDDDDNGGGGGTGVTYASLSTGDVGEMNDDSLLDNADHIDGTGATGTNTASASGNHSHAPPSRTGFASDATEMSLRAFCGGVAKKNAVRKVRYGSNFAKRLLSRPGSVTAVKADMPGLVLARVRFLLENPGMLPDYHRMAANGECATVWCRIGRFITLQGSSILQIMFFGQAGGAVAGGVVASSVSLWAPMPGLWGAVGWWWYVPITVAYPIIVPILVTFGLASLLPLEILRRYRNKWKKHTQELNREFWILTDEDTKTEYFGTTATADDEWVRRFFGAKDGDADDEANNGQYMPVGEGGDEDDLDDELERKYSTNMASAYNAEFGESPDQDDGKFNMMQTGLLARWNKSLRGSKNMSEEDLRGDDAVPLSSGDYAGRPERPGMMKSFSSWRQSWTNRSSSGGSRGALVGGRQGSQFGDKTFKDFDDDDIPASQGLMS